MADAHLVWIRTERRLAGGAFVLLAGFLLIFFPDARPPSPAELLRREVPNPDCAFQSALRQVEVDAELAKATPNFIRADLRGKDLSGIFFTRAQMAGADLSGATLNGTVFDTADMRCARLVAVKSEINTKFLNSTMAGAWMNDAVLPNALFPNSDLTGANLSGAVLKGADLRDANLAGAVFDGTQIAGARMGGANVALADFRPVDAASGGEAVGLHGLGEVILSKPEFAGLTTLTAEFTKAGLWEQANDVKATIARWKRHFALTTSQPTPLSKWLSTMCQEFYLGLLSADGSQPLRPFWLLAVLILTFAAIYWAALVLSENSFRILKHDIEGEGEARIPAGAVRSMPAALLFSASKSLSIALPLFSVLDVLASALNTRVPYRSSGWVTHLSVVQSLLTVLLFLSLFLT